MGRLQLCRAPSRRWACAALLASGLLLSGRGALAGAWTRDPGSGYLKLSYGASSSNDQFGFDGLTRPILEGVTDYPFADRSLYFYGEFGLRQGLTLVGEAAIKRIFIHDRIYRSRTVGLGNLGASLRVRLLDSGPWVASAEAGVSLPSGYRRNLKPPLGAGQADFSLAGNLGHSFYPVPAYATASAGVRLRSRMFLSSTDPEVVSFGNESRPSYSDEFFYSVEGGWSPAGKLLLRIHLQGLRSLRSSGSAFSLTDIPTTQRYLKAGGGATWSLSPRLALDADLSGTPTGTNTARSVDISLGVALQW